MDLYEATEGKHHACHQHPLGQRMAKGQITRQEWADWLSVLAHIHTHIDPWIVVHMARGALLKEDLRVTGVEPRDIRAHWDFVAGIKSPEAAHGVGYVMHGAHRRGGAMMRVKLERAGLPSAHTFYALPQEAEAWVKDTRARGELASHANACFEALLAAMDEIEGLGNG